MSGIKGSGIFKVCKYCEGRFYNPKWCQKIGKGIFCSDKCIKLWRKRNEKILKCSQCNKKIHRKQFELQYKNYFCSMKCKNSFHSNSIRKENNSNWRGGFSRTPYPIDWTEDLKEVIRKRDNYKCHQCGAPQEEFIRKFPVHHKDEDKNNLNPDNLITLCSACHTRLHDKKRRKICLIG